MDEKDLKKLSRADLLEMLVEISKENDRLKQALKEKDEQLQNRQITVSEAGSLAEASLKLNEVFESAQKAADDYLYNLKIMEKAKVAELKEIHRMYKKLKANEEES